MTKLFIEDLSLTNKKALVRVDFNVPLDNDGNIIDATRIEAALPTIQSILDKGGIPILMSHLGRPRNEMHPEFSLKPVANMLSILLDRPVQLAPNCIGEAVQELIHHLKPGDIALLENLRFHRAEEHPEEDPSFAQKLAQYGDLYINDAFGTAHRKHSSTYTIAQYFPGQAAAGYLLAKEVSYLSDLLTQPKRPFYSLVGGNKISNKLGLIESLLIKSDKVFIGGGMAYTFIKATGLPIGDSLCDDHYLTQAGALLKKYSAKIILPIDCIAATACDEEAPSQTFPLIGGGIPPGYQALDIGSQTLKLLEQQITDGKTVLWNGPFGVYELDRFAKGTLSLASFISTLSATTVIAGGDLIAAFKKAGVSDNVSHISTGGGATLEFLQYGTLPAIEVLSEKPTTLAQKKN